MEQNTKGINARISQYTAQMAYWLRRGGGRTRKDGPRNRNLLEKMGYLKHYSYVIILPS